MFFESNIVINIVFIIVLIVLDVKYCFLYCFYCSLTTILFTAERAHPPPLQPRPRACQRAGLPTPAGPRVRCVPLRAKALPRSCARAARPAPGGRDPLAAAAAMEQVEVGRRGRPCVERDPLAAAAAEEQAEEGRRGRPCTPHRSSENGGRPHRTGPCRLAPMGPNFQTHVYEPLGELHGELWAQGAAFGRVGPLRRQLLLLYHPCLAYLSQPLECSDGPENGRSARRPT